MYTQPFSQLKKTDADIAGGKGASLGEMTQAGIPVPPGFVVLASTFSEFLQQNNLNTRITQAIQEVNYEDTQALEELSRALEKDILAAQMPEALEQELLEHFDMLEAKTVAVRSSATAEDSSEASWAGELNTYLHVSREDVAQHVKQCWASLYTPRALFYRHEKGMLEIDVAVAVVIQKMVHSEVSGVCFTVHPVTQNYDHMVIEAGFGLGEAIVGGMITPDTFVIDMSAEPKIIERYISEQSMMIVQSAEGTQEADVPQEKREQQKLADEYILKLAKLCKQIETHYGSPQDIEWAYESSTLYITQSRPITTLSQ